MSHASRLDGLMRDALKLVRHSAVRIVAPQKQNHIVFVAGVQRSGTNLIMDILELSPDTKVFHERDARAFWKYQLREDAVVQRLARSVAPCVVFKALCDNERVPGLMAEFAHSSALWVYRNFDDVIASHIALWPKGRNKIDALVKDRMSADWRGRGMTDRTWEIVRAHYRPQMGSPSCAALFWYYRNQLFFDNGFDQNPKVYVLRYEEMLEHPQSEIGKLTRFLGIRQASDMASHVEGGTSRRKPPQVIDDRIRTLCEEMQSRLDAVWASRRTQAGPLGA
jgi:Sulfotransferase domain